MGYCLVSRNFQSDEEVNLSGDKDQVDGAVCCRDLSNKVHTGPTRGSVAIRPANGGVPEKHDSWFSKEGCDLMSSD